MYNGLTKVGQEYLATRQAQSLPVVFTKVKIGNGAPASDVDPATLTDVVSEMMVTEIYDKTQSANVATLKVQISNEDVATQFYMTELAFFVDDNGTDVMYWYYNTAEGRIIRDSSTPAVYRPMFNIAVSNLPSLTLDYTGKNLWIDKSYLQTFTDALKAEIIAVISGGEYGGFVQAVGTKELGKTYIDTLTNSIVTCTANTDIEFVDLLYFAYFSNKYLLGKVNSFDKTTTFTTSGTYTFPNGESVNYGLTAKKRGNNVFYLVTAAVTVRGTGDSGFYTIFSGIPSEFQPTNTTHILLVGNYNEGYLRKVVISGGNIQMMSATYPAGSSIGGNASCVAAN